MPHVISELSEHYIICGYGRVGREVGTELHRRRCPFVAIDSDSTVLAGADVHTISGDATDDDVLSAGGVARARGLIAGTGNDATNLAIALSAHALNATLYIVARANQPEVEAKLLRAGASRVVSPYAIGAHRMATQLVSPGIAAFLDTIRGADQVDLWIEEITVAADASLDGQLIGEALPRSAGLPNLIAIRRIALGHLVHNPSPSVRLVPGDTLIVVGSRLALGNLLARASRPHR